MRVIQTKGYAVGRRRFDWPDRDEKQLKESLSNTPTVDVIHNGGVSLECFIRMSWMKYQTRRASTVSVTP